MVADLENFGHLTIARRASGEPVTVVRSPDEVVFLAFDNQIKRLVELHILRRGEQIHGAAKTAAMEQAQLATSIRAASFMNLLEVGEDQGIVYYTSNLNDGEFLEDYVLRRGALPPATVYLLLLQLMDDFATLKDHPKVASSVRFDRVLVTSVEDTFLQLRLYDLGVSMLDTEGDAIHKQVIQICELLFLMLTGKRYAGENPDRYPVLTSLPMSLRTTMRSALTDPANAPKSAEKLRQDLREAHGSQVSSIQTRSMRKTLVITSTLQPLSQLQDMLLEAVSIQKILGNRFVIEDPDHVKKSAFSIPCLSVKTDQQVTVHLLPPSRLVDKSQYEAVPLQSWRFSADKHPNILRSLTLWETPEWSFLTEEREPGFPLSRLMMDRLTLNPNEVAIILRQVLAGLDQANECGVEKLDLHPSNIFLRVGRSGPMQSRDTDRLLQKRLDAWPAFLVKLRVHLTMRNLYEPPLVEINIGKNVHGEHHSDRESRQHSFVFLAAYLLSGERPQSNGLIYPESVPQALGDYISQTLEEANQKGIFQDPVDFLAKFESILAGPVTVDFATRLRGASVTHEEMESVGSVSDFDDDQDLSVDGELNCSPISRRLHAHEFDCHTRKKSSSWPIWAAAAVVVFGMIAWWFMQAAPVESTVTSVAPTQPLPVVPKIEIPDNQIEVAALKTPIEVKPEVKIETVVPKVVAPTIQTPQTASTLPIVNPPIVNKPLALPMTPPEPITVPNPVIIRKAIMPSAEEIAKFKQGQINSLITPPQPVQVTPPTPQEQKGSMPTMKMTSLTDAAQTEGRQ